jgi:mannitol/fructose-specific phosphotransferase system IIA component (Ntr-type)
LYPCLSRQQEEAPDENFKTFMFASAKSPSKTATPLLPSLAELGSRRAAAQETLRAKEPQDILKFFFKPYNKLITDRIIMK